MESKLQPSPVPGDTLRLRLTVPVKLKDGLRTMEDCAVEAASTVTDGESAANVKSLTL